MNIQKLVPVDLAAGETRVCYKCSSRLGVMKRELKTPSGGSFWRAWCEVCLVNAGVDPEGLPKITDEMAQGFADLQAAQAVEEADKGDGEVGLVIEGFGRLKPGQRISATLAGTFLHAVPGTADPRELIVLVGTKGYVVPETAELRRRRQTNRS